MRPIDAEQLEQIFNNEVEQGATDLFDAFDYALEHVDTLTPESLVKRGRWEEMRNAYGDLEGWLCECGREVKSKERFCPSCGAKMVEG